MKVAFLIAAHKDIEHLARIVNAISHPSFFLFIHIDQKSEFDESCFSSLLVDDTNVFLVAPRANVSWGGFSQVEVTFDLINTALEYDAFDYFYLISGQDFPIKSPELILRFLDTKKGTEFLECFPLPNQEKWTDNGGTDRYHYFWLVDEIGLERSYMFVERQKVEGIKREFPFSLVLYGGSSWFTLTRQCVAHILKYLSENPSLVKYFKYTLCSDEILIPTLVMNSTYARNVENNNLRYIDWVKGPEYPRVLTTEDLPALLKSERHFARKFDPAKDEAIISALENSVKIS